VNDKADAATTVVKHTAPEEAIDRVEINGRPSEYTRNNGDLEIPLPVPQRKLARVSIHAKERAHAPLITLPLPERLWIAARRYACDFRDNFFHRSGTLLKGTQRLR
jgi:hypothetical protein